MAIVGILLLIIFVLSSLLLILLVLIQDEQGEGLGGIFGGGSATPFGSRSGNILTRITSIVGAVFLFCSFGLAWINRTPEVGDVIGAARRSATEQGGGVEWWNESPAIEAQDQAGDDAVVPDEEVAPAAESETTEEN